VASNKALFGTKQNSKTASKEMLDEFNLGNRSILTLIG
jgi:hypothetical protein